MQKIDFIIPFHNEHSILPKLLLRLDFVAQKVHLEFGYDVGYIFVDDGSSDEGFSLLCNYDFGTRRVHLLQFSRNFGKEAALSAGIEAAKGSEVGILLDADLEHPPELIIEFIKVWKSDKRLDCIYAYKANRSEGEGKIKSLMSRFFYYLINKGGGRFNIPEDAGDFRLISREYMDALLSLPESERFMKGLYGWVGFLQKGIPFRPEKCSTRQSNYRWKTLLLVALDALTSFSIIPLRIMTLSGLVIAVVSFMYGMYIVLERLLYSEANNGTASILTLIAFFGGMQMIFLGILGEYIGKIVLEVKRRPTYILSKDISYPKLKKCKKN